MKENKLLSKLSDVLNNHLKKGDEYEINITTKEMRYGLKGKIV